MSSLKKIIKSFDQQNELNQKIWGDDGQMKKKVRDRLIEITNEFVDFIDLDIIVSDIIMTGSLANYNWSEYSDVDLHLIVDFKQFSETILPLYEDLFKLKKTIFNEKHNITIYGYDVELYVQNEQESHFSSGIYSVLNDEWINKPTRKSTKIDTTLIENKVQQWMKSIDNLLENLKGESIDVINQYMKKFKEKLKKYRSSGLEKGGENSDENLVFKSLRRNGYIQKLFDFENRLIDKKLSINEAEKSDKVETDIEKFYKTLELIDTPISQQNKGEYSFEKNVETIQIALSLLGYELPRFGVDGKYGPETGSAVEKFKQENLKSIKKKDDELVDLDKKNKVLPPVNMSNITSKFGSRWGRQHSGVDIGVPSGTEIKSPADGEVINADFRSGACGGTIFIKHGDNIKTRYCHCKRIDVSKGDIVKQGEIIGLTGGGSNDKGKGNSQGPHLHFETYMSGVVVDPLTIIDKKYVGSLQSSDVVSSVATPEMIKVIIEKLKEKNIKPEDIKKFTTLGSIDLSTVELGTDKKFYEEILKGVGAPITDENLKFLYSWRKAEGGKATNNPFNTTQKLSKDKGISNYNSVGVKNYSTPQFGLEATIRTLLNGRYSCIIDGLRNDIGAEKISQCSSLKTWGTGDLVYKVIRSGKITPPPIYS